MSDPYRDNLENRVQRLEKRIEEVKTFTETKTKILSDKLDNAKLTPSIWGSIKSAFYNFTHWREWGSEGGIIILVIVGLAVIFTVGVPSCVQSCNADNQHERELEFQTHQEACESLGLHFLEENNSRADNHYVVCTGNNRVVYVNPEHPERSYSRTIEQLEEVQINNRIVYVNPEHPEQITDD